jgi:glycosyltransferase involved in cell wall biosynthesis
MMLKISVVTAVFNKHDTVAGALDSLFSQTYSGVESVVIDGGSSDGTLAVLEKYRDRVAVLVSEPDGGIYDALNKGIARSSGDVIGFLHADDVLADAQVLQRIATAFEDPQVDAVYADLKYVKHDDVNRQVRYWRSREFTPALLRRGWMPPHPTFYVRRAVYEKMGGFDTRYRIAADYDSILRFFGSKNFFSCYIPHVLVLMRTGGASNRSLRNIIIKSREDYSALRRNRVGGLLTLVSKNLSKLGQFFLR